MGSANSDSVGRYSGARGRPRSHAGTGVSAGPPAATAGGDIGARGG
uniref:ELF6 n=1 Tax=Arundo donax TaxID=35708 RepID=A0A0A9EKW0_ARUDO